MLRHSKASVCALVSGGLDSAVLLSRLSASGARVLPLYLRCGYFWEPAELACLRRYLRRRPASWPLRVIDMPLGSLFRSHWSMTRQGIPGARAAITADYLPGRNALLLSLAAVAADQHGIGTVAIGTLKSNPFGDATPAFFRQMARALSSALSRRVRVIAPLSRLSKAQVIRQAGGTPLELTRSCLRARNLRHCGRCIKCTERRKAFRESGVKDPTVYVS